MSHASRAREVVLVLSVLAVCTVAGSGGQWARQPGERVRDAFGPTRGQLATTCRGACGGGCPSSCAMTVTYECTGPETLRRVRSYSCGTHQGCREHDDCLDRCRQRQGQGFDCEGQCHSEAMKQWGFEAATSWVAGGGPFDDAPIIFEYTRDTPQGPEPVFRCPEGARLACAGAAGRCVTAGGVEATPVFDSYAGDPDAVRISGFRSGRVCRGGATAPEVCEPAIDIRVTGDARCDQSGTSKPCTWYGFELQYANADPSAPLLCSSSGADDDFLGGLMKNALAAMPADQATELGAAIGAIQKELGSGRSLSDVFSGIKVTPAGKPGIPATAKPDSGASPGVPRSIPFPSASGRLLVPMFELTDGAAPGSVLVREVRCTHNGAPVLETTFRLHFSRR